MRRGWPARAALCVERRGLADGALGAVPSSQFSWGSSTTGFHTPHFFVVFCGVFLKSKMGCDLIFMCYIGIYKRISLGKLTNYYVRQPRRLCFHQHLSGLRKKYSNDLKKNRWKAGTLATEETIRFWRKSGSCYVRVRLLLVGVPPYSTRRLIVTMSRHQWPWRRYAFYWAPFWLIFFSADRER